MTILNCTIIFILENVEKISFAYGKLIQSVWKGEWPSSNALNSITIVACFCWGSEM